MPLSDLIGLGVLTSTVPREVIDGVVQDCGKQAKRSGGMLPPHVMLYFVMASALFATDDYEAVFEHLAGSLAVFGGCDLEWEVPTSGGVTQAMLTHQPPSSAESVQRDVLDATCPKHLCAVRHAALCFQIISRIQPSRGLPNHDLSI